MYRLPCLLVAGWVLAPAIGLAQESWPSWIDRKQEYEQWLLNAEVLEVKDVGEGVTNPKKAKLQMGDTVFYLLHHFGLFFLSLWFVVHFFTLPFTFPGEAESLP